MSRNYTFDVLKFVFAIGIALFHYSTYLSGVGVVVELFFILSGFFLSKEYYYNKCRNKVISPYNYTVKHIKKLYLPYLFALFMIFLYPYIKDIILILKRSNPEHTIKDFIIQIYDLIPEVFMVQNIGIYQGGINYPLWQVCVLIVASHFIYSLLCINDKFTINVICPLLFICIYTLLTDYNNIGYDIWGKIYCFYVPLLRGIAPVSLGVVLYKIVEKNMSICENKYGLLLVNIMLCLSIVGVILLDRYNYLYLLFACAIIFAVSCERTWINFIFNRSIFKILGPLSYSIYLNHALLIYVFKDATVFIENKFNLFINDVLLNFIFIVVLLLYSLMTMCIVNLIGESIKRLL